MSSMPEITSGTTLNPIACQSVTRTGIMPRMKKCARCGEPFDEAKARKIFDPEYGKNIYDGKYRAEVCHDCVMLDINSDDPEEIWFECDDCVGSAEVFVPNGPDENVGSMQKCPGCDGFGTYEGTPNDLPSKSKRVFNF